MNSIVSWIQENPWATFAIVVYVIANIGPRPHPGKQKGWKKVFWTIIDRLCILTVDRVPGRVKMLLMDSPTDPDASGKSEKDKDDE